MKTPLHCFIFASLFGLNLCEAQQVTTSQTSVPSPTPYSIVANDANSRIWERTNYAVSPNGRSVSQIQRFTELATGLNYQDPSTGQWAPSQEEIDILPNGTAAATTGQHQVYFPGDIYQGEIELVTPDGIQLQSRPMGISYDDGTNTVLIAVLTNSVGQLAGSNQVIYPNAFKGLNADLLYTYTKAGFEQDIILHEQPPSPAASGLDPATTRLQVLTEFFNSPQPALSSTPLPAQAGITLNDETLDFGVMKMMPGRAFLLGTDARDTGVWVGKSWVQINGRQFLVEEVPLGALADQLASLPASQVTKQTKVFPSIASHALQLPPQHLAKASPFVRPIQLTQNAFPSKGLIFDYQTLSANTTNYDFQGDTTYYISGNVVLSGTNNIFEGGTVIKYARGYGITLSSSAAANWSNGPYRPVIFTAKDDNSVGDSISGSSGSPSGYYANPALDFAGTNISTISHARFAYAQTGVITASGSSAPWLYNDQFVNCQSAAQFNGSIIYLRNILFAGVQTNFVNLGATDVDLQNATFNNITSLATVLSGTPNLYLTNCIFANVTNYGPVLTNAGYNGFYNSTPFGYDSQTSTSYPFQTVGAGNYYLTNGSSFLSAGTGGIDPVLLTNLGQATTHPPTVYSNTTISGSVTFTPQVQRDTNSNPDLGYHYTPLDYAVGGVTVSGTLTLTNGVAVAAFQAVSGGYEVPGFSESGSGSLVLGGTATLHNQICHYAAVQEQPILWGGGSFAGEWLINASLLSARFTDFSGLAGLGTENEFADVILGSPGPSIGGGDPIELNLRDCRVGPGGIICNTYQGTGTNICFNNLFDRGGIDIGDFDGDSPVVMINNLVHNGYANFDNEDLAYTWTVQNNFFDNSTLNWTSDSGSPGLCENHNGYWNTTQLTPTNANDVVVTNFIYATGPLGNYYQESTNLLHEGSATAPALGLYDYTVQTNLVGGDEIAEGTNTVSVGFHYVATDQNGNPLDTYEAGIPNYIVDAQGNGMDANGLPYWWEGEYFFQVGLNPSSDPDDDGHDLLYDYENNIDPNVINFYIVTTNSYINVATMTLQLADVTGIPDYEAVLINDTNEADAVWEPYTGTNVLVTFGADGNYNIEIGLRGLPANATQTWQSTALTKITTAPILTITNPTASAVSQSPIQIQGYANEGMSTLTFDVSNVDGLFTNQQAYLTGQFYDTNLLAYTTNDFQSADVDLAEGTNIITFHATDWAGNKTNLSFTFNYTASPAFTVTWPQPGTAISGSSFTLQGQITDPTSKITAAIVDPSGDTNTVQGFAEANGTVWVQNLLLSSGTNNVTITASDANATNVTDFAVVGNDVGLVINPLASDQLNQSSVTVTGEIGNTSLCVWVNGVQASVSTNGSWIATNVPVSPTGTACLSVQVYEGDSVLVDSQNLYQPQPVAVGMTSYAGRHIINEPDAWDVNEAINWNYLTGGNCTGPYGFSITPDIDGIAYANFSGDIEPFNEYVYDGPNPIPWEYASISVANIYGSYQGSVRTHVMVEPGGQQVAGTTNLYLVFASVNEFSTNETASLEDSGVSGTPFSDLFDFGGLGWAGSQEYYGDTPLPPGSLEVDGHTLVNSGISNTASAYYGGAQNGYNHGLYYGAYGYDQYPNIWGVTIVAAPAGKNWDITPSYTNSTANIDYTFDVMATNIMLLSQCVATTPSNQSRTNLGVGEQVDLYFNLALPTTNITWSTTAGTLVATSGPTNLFTAPDNATNVTITATVGKAPVNLNFNIIAPTGALLENVPDTLDTSTNPLALSYYANWYVQPDDVSFYNVQIAEGVTNSIATGYFYPAENNETHVPGIPLQGGTVVPGKGTLCGGGYPLGSDHISGGSEGPPYSNGTFTWHIPWSYITPDGKTNYFTTVDHIKTLTVTSSNAVLSIDKQGSSGSVTINY
jgi:hypothetical protein